MFEMKNEGDETATKHKNRDFYKELDKDRNEKNCEYAVLVTMGSPILLNSTKEKRLATYVVLF